MDLISCNSICPLARKCQTHVINRPNQKTKDQIIKKHEPKLRENCPGYEELK